VAAAAAQVDKQQRWLPRLAPHLPLSIGLIELPYYRRSNFALADDARRTIQQVLAERAQGG